jgi:hypothetical protein
MLKMAKKKNIQKVNSLDANPPKKRGLKITLDRFATTFKADDATVIMGDIGRTIPSVDSKPQIYKTKNKLVTGMSDVARNLMPKRNRLKKSVNSAKPAKNRLKNIANQMPSNKINQRSNMRYFVAIIVGMLAGGSYFAYDRIGFKMPDLNISKTVNTTFSDLSKSNKNKKIAKKKVYRKSTKKTRSYSKARRSNKRISKSVYSGDYRRGRKIRKLSRSAQKRKWASGLAKLKRTSKSKYRRAKYKRRNR